MTYRFSANSLDNLVGVHPKLVDVVMDVMAMQVMDFSVKEGVRTTEKQQEYFSKGVTKTLKSKHLKQKDGYGWAVDLYPSPVDMAAVNKGNAKEIARFGVIAGLMFACASARGVKIIWGGDWNKDGRTLDHSFFDAPHFELVL